MSFKEQAEKLGIKVDGRWSDARIQEEIDKVTAAEKAGPKTAEEILKDGGSITKPSSDPSIVWEISEISEEANANRMNNLAMRIFEGQGSISDAERVKRIIRGLKAQGYTEFDKLDLPIHNLQHHVSKNG